MFGSADRHSLQFSQRSQTTISTYDEVTTPRSNRSRHFDFQITEVKPVQGPRGPHLFRASQSSGEFNFDHALQLSPILPKELPPSRAETAFRTPIVAARPFQPMAPLDTGDVRSWNSHQVATWMYELGFDEVIVERFEMHDITGAVLLDLQFEDLKELDIPSFGKRHRLWNEIESLRIVSDDSYDGHGNLPGQSETPFEDISRPCTAARQLSRNGRSQSRPRLRGAGVDEDDHHKTHDDADGNGVTSCSTRRRRGRKPRRHGDEAITPAESVSIVAIEQLLPKPHKCAKGERCAKWRKQQKQLAKLRDEHAFPISPEKGGHIFVAGDPGNAGSAAKLVDNVVLRPQSDAIPSVVASSDVLGPGELSSFAAGLQEDALRGLEHRDPQENVKNFLNLQHMNAEPAPHFDEDRPPTPPLDLFPPLHANNNTHNYPPMGLVPTSASVPVPHSNLKMLPKLSIPRSASAQPQANPHLYPPYPLSADPQSALSTFSPCRSATTSPAVGTSLYRYGTPASEMDVPVTAVPVGPVARDTSQSVPPNMQFRDPVARSGSRNAAQEWRRPSFAMPRLDEGEVYSPIAEADERPQTAVDRSNMLARTKSLRSGQVATQPQPQQHQQKPTSTADGNKYPNVKHAGWMKKRRNRLLRHEWQDSHFRLTGTVLAMHKDEKPAATLLQTIDVDDYAVACGSNQSGIKLGARLKALKIASSSSSGPGGGAAGVSGADRDWIEGKPGSKDPAAFTFQLVPQAHGVGFADSSGHDGANVLRKGGHPGAGAGAAAAAKKTTHHFAVRNRDDRIDWMRELMLAKALKAKHEGFEVKVNGNAV